MYTSSDISSIVVPLVFGCLTSSVSGIRHSLFRASRHPRKSCFPCFVSATCSLVNVTSQFASQNSATATRLFVIPGSLNPLFACAGMLLSCNVIFSVVLIVLPLGIVTCFCISCLFALRAIAFFPSRVMLAALSIRAVDVSFCFSVSFCAQPGLLELCSLLIHLPFSFRPMLFATIAFILYPPSPAGSPLQVYGSQSLSFSLPPIVFSLVAPS